VSLERRLAELLNWRQWVMRVLKKLKVGKLPETKHKQYQRSWSHCTNEFDIYACRMLWWYIIQLENENDLLMKVNVQRKTCNRKQNGNSGSKQHAHVNQRQNLTISPMPVEHKATMNAHKLINGFAFGVTF